MIFTSGIVQFAWTKEKTLDGAKLVRESTLRNARFVVLVLR